MFQRLSSVPLMGKLCSSSIWIRNNWCFCGEQVLIWLLFIYLIYPSHPFLTRQNPLRFLFIVSVKVEKSPCCFILLYASVCSSFYALYMIIFLKGYLHVAFAMMELWLHESCIQYWFLEVCSKSLPVWIVKSAMFSLWRAGSHEDRRWLTVVLVKPSKSEWLWRRQCSFRVTFPCAREKERE